MAEHIARVRQIIDRILGNNFLKELEKRRDQGSVTAPAYAVLLDDLNSLLNN